MQAQRAILKIRKLNSYIGWFVLNEVGGGSGSNERLSKRDTIAKVKANTICNIVGVFDEDRQIWLEGGPL